MIFEIKNIIVHDIWYDTSSKKCQKRFFASLYLAYEYVEIKGCIGYFKMNDLYVHIINDKLEETSSHELFNTIIHQNYTIKSVFNQDIKDANVFEKNIDIYITEELLTMHRLSGSLTGISGLALATRTNMFYPDSSESFGGYITYALSDLDKTWIIPLTKYAHVRVLAIENFSWLKNSKIDIITTEFIEHYWTLTFKNYQFKASSLLLANNNHDAFDVNVFIEMNNIDDSYIENIWLKNNPLNTKNQYGISYSYNNHDKDITYQAYLKEKNTICLRCPYKSTCLNIEGPRGKIFDISQIPCPIAKKIKP